MLTGAVMDVEVGLAELAYSSKVSSDLGECNSSLTTECAGVDLCVTVGVADE